MRKTVCVFCASSDRIPDVYRQVAADLGQRCALAGITMVNGAGCIGLMGVSTDACLSHGGKVIGVIPQFMVDNHWHHEHLTQLIITADMTERKRRMLELSDGIIVMPGGCGTIEELFTAITQRQLGLYHHPIILLNTEGYFNPFADLLSRALRDHFMRPEHAQLWEVAATPEEALRLFIQSPDITITAAR